jgi:acylphosphatase
LKFNRMAGETLLYLPLHGHICDFVLTNMDEKLLFKINVRGYVQGVGFRWSAAREANSRGITGFVKNLSDGSVYIEAEGSSEQLKLFVERCKNGPGFVESVDFESFPAINYKDFRIEF